jgi:serine/threonine-protein kinase
MAPEQCRGEQVDGRADLYALGCTLYEMLSGTPPFGWGETNAMEVMAAQLYQPAPKMSAQRWDLLIPEPVEDAVLRALAKRPEERWPNAKAMRDGLFAALTRAAEPDAPREGKFEVRAAAEVVLPPSRVQSDRPVGLAGAQLAQVATALGAAGLTVRELPAPPLEGAPGGQMPQLAGLGALVVAAAPGRSALLLAERFAALADAPPVLLCGPEDDLQEMAQAIAAGIFDYVPLPLDPADLSRKVARALRQRR